jgi:hypothetical protein
VIGTITIPSTEFFYGELITGLLITTPFLIFAVPLLWWLFCDPTLPSQGIAALEGGRVGQRASLKPVVAFLLLGF